MPKFGSKSRKNLETCDERLQQVFNEVVKSYDCSVTCGYRGEEDQNKAFDEGHSKVKYPYGRHNSDPSTAVDVYPYPVNMKGLDRMIHFAGFVLGVAKAMGIDDPTEGVMAQELIKVDPSAVLMGEDGYYRVDYSKVDRGQKQA